MKKIILFLLFFISITFAHAEVAKEEWKYIFHLEERGGTLSVNTNEKFPYDLMAMGYENGAINGVYYGEIVSVRGVSLARIWFTPTMVVAAQNKKIIDLSAPYFANADRIDFYSKNDTKIFSVSLLGSSFCNDNNVCNADAGENYENCAYDCIAPEGEEIPTPPPAQPIPPTVTQTDNIAPPVPTTPPTGSPEPEIVRTVVDAGTTSKLGGTVTLVAGVFLVLLSILGIILMKRKKLADSY